MLSRVSCRVCHRASLAGPNAFTPKLRPFEIVAVRRAMIRTVSSSFRSSGLWTHAVKPALLCAVVGAGAFIGAAYYHTHVRLVPAWREERSRILSARAVGRHGDGGLLNWWNQQSDGVRMVCGVTAVNTSVFLGWKALQLLSSTGRFRGFAIVLNRVMRTFLHDPHRPGLASLIGANFSHSGLMHLSVNSFVVPPSSVSFNLPNQLFAQFSPMYTPLCWRYTMDNSRAIFNVAANVFFYLRRTVLPVCSACFSGSGTRPICSVCTLLRVVFFNTVTASVVRWACDGINAWRCDGMHLIDCLSRIISRIEVQAEWCLPARLCRD